MADTVAAGVQDADTDYRYQGMADSFIAANSSQRDAQVRQSIDAQGALAKGFAAMNILVDQWIGSITQIMPSIVANAIASIGAVGADDALEFVKVGAALSNSGSPPVPAYQNLGTGGPGQGFNLPSKSTMTVTTP